MDIADINRRVIEQFRAGGEIEGMHRNRIVLPDFAGHQAGTEHITPVVALTGTTG
jgi:hypothetical protein